MSILCVVLLIISFVSICVGLVFLALRKAVTYKVWLIIFAVVITLLFSTLLILTTFIPKKTTSLIFDSREYLERQINAVQPDYTSQVLDVSSLKNLIRNAKSTSTYLSDNDTASLIIQLVGAKSFMYSLDVIVSNLDKNLSYFETNNIPLTIHNVFVYAQESSRPIIMKVVKILQWVILVLAILSYLIWIISFTTLKPASTTYGE